MAFSLYEAGVPAVIHHLTALSTIIDKAMAHCTQHKIDPSILVNYRLAPDMFPFSRQVQIATDQAKGMAARLGGLDVPSYADTETTFEDLKARIAKTIAFVKSVTPAQIDVAEDKDIAFKAGQTELKFKGAQYLTSFVLPNFYFHVTAAYAILRHAGVAIGKWDFLGKA